MTAVRSGIVRRLRHAPGRRVEGVIVAPASDRPSVEEVVERARSLSPAETRRLAAAYRAEGTLLGHLSRDIVDRVVKGFVEGPDVSPWFASARAIVARRVDRRARGEARRRIREGLREAAGGRREAPGDPVDPWPAVHRIAGRLAVVVLVTVVVTPASFGSWNLPILPAAALVALTVAALVLLRLRRPAGFDAAKALDAAALAALDRPMDARDLEDLLLAPWRTALTGREIPPLPLDDRLVMLSLYVGLAACALGVAADVTDSALAPLGMTATMAGSAALVGGVALAIGARVNRAIISHGSRGARNGARSPVLLEDPLWRVAQWRTGRVRSTPFVRILAAVGLGALVVAIVAAAGAQLVVDPIITQHLLTTAGLAVIVLLAVGAGALIGRAVSVGRSVDPAHKRRWLVSTLQGVGGIVASFIGSFAAGWLVTQFHDPADSEDVLFAFVGLIPMLLIGAIPLAIGNLLFTAMLARAPWRWAPPTLVFGTPIVVGILLGWQIGTPVS